MSLLSLSVSVVSHASGVKSHWVENAQFLKQINAQKQQPSKHIVVSEQSGFALLDENKASLSSINRKAEHLDFRLLPAQKDIGIMTTLDINTGEVLLVEVDLSNDKLAIKQTLKPAKAAFDAVCLSATDNSIELFTVNVLGSAVHYSVYREANQEWQLNEINRFPIGPNVKSCAVNDRTNTLYVTEENIGVWRYSTNPEHELSRELIQLPTKKGQILEVEYVDTTSSGDTVIVSPSVNTLWLFNQANQQLKPISLAEEVAPKTVQVSRDGTTLVTHMFDDEAEKLVNKKITNIDVPVFKKEATITSLPPYAQTEPVLNYGDAADDPAIWINHKSPKASLVYATDKKHGLNIYNLGGKLLKTLPVGRVNNVDIRYNVQLKNEVVDIAATSNRSNKSITLFKINQATGMPKRLADIKTDLADPYGLCMSQNESLISVWINDTDGRFQRYNLDFTADKITAIKAFEWNVPSQPEGCISDDATQRLFYGEESTGVWLKDMTTNNAAQLITGLDIGVEADIEGMSLYQLEGKNYLLVSSQGNNRYAVYAVDNNHKFLGVFSIGANWQNNIDGASETDGLAVTSTYLGPQLPNGLLVVQDGHNVMPKAPQNFKLVDGTLLHNWITDKVKKH